MKHYSEFGISTETKDYFEAYLKWLVKTAPGQKCEIGIGVGHPNSKGIMLLHVYEISNWNNTGLPQYCDGFLYNLSRRSLEYFGTVDGVYYFYSS